MTTPIHTVTGRVLSVSAGADGWSGPPQTGDPLVREDVGVSRRLDDLGRQRRRRNAGGAVPARTRRRQPVAHDLLVERGLVLPGPPRLGRPQARRVGRQDLVA